MAKLNEIREFLGGSMEVEITEDKTLTIYPLTVEEMTSLYPSNFEDMSIEEKQNISYNLLLKSLKDDSVTIEDIKNLTASLFTKLTESISKLNGFDINKENEHIGAIKEKIARAKKTKQ